LEYAKTNIEIYCGLFADDQMLIAENEDDLQKSAD
jgi:hypothetical protein